MIPDYSQVVVGEDGSYDETYYAPEHWTVGYSHQYHESFPIPCDEHFPERWFVSHITEALIWDVPQCIDPDTGAPYGIDPATGEPFLVEPYVDSVSNISNGGSYDGDLITWSIGTVPPGQGGSLTYQATLLGDERFDSGGTPVQNTTVTYSDQVQPGQTHGLEADAVVMVWTEDVPLTIGKMADPGGASPGDTISYTITYQNQSDATIANVVITDDPHMTYFDSISNISPGGSQDPDSHIITWSIGDLGPGESGSVSYEATLKGNERFPKDETHVGNIATIDSDVTEPISVTAVVTVWGQDVPLIISKTADRASAAPGDTITYTITYHSKGGAPATGVVITDNPHDTLEPVHVLPPLACEVAYEREFYGATISDGESETYRARFYYDGDLAALADALTFNTHTHRFDEYMPLTDEGEPFDGDPSWKMVGHDTECVADLVFGDWTAIPCQPGGTEPELTPTPAPEVVDYAVIALQTAGPGFRNPQPGKTTTKTHVVVVKNEGNIVGASPAEVSLTVERAHLDAGCGPPSVSPASSSVTLDPGRRERVAFEVTYRHCSKPSLYDVDYNLEATVSIPGDTDSSNDTLSKTQDAR